MKKILSLILVLSMLLAVTPLTTFAADYRNYEVSFNYIEVAPQIDGIVNTNEYGSALPFHTYSTSKAQFKDKEHNKLVGEWDVDFHTAWDDNNLYLAWVVYSDVHGPLPDAQFGYSSEPIEGTKISDDPKAALSNMWAYSSVMFLITPGAPDRGIDYSANYLEVGFCEDANGNTQIAIWKVPNNMNLADVNLNEWFAVANRDETKKITTYEIAIPWEYSGIEAVGDQQQFGLAYEVSTQEYYYKNNRAEMAMIEWQDAMLSTKFPNRCAVVTLQSAHSDKPIDGLKYALSDDGTYYIVDDYNCSATEIVILSEYNGLPIKAIREYAFYDCDNLTSITIPDSITTIGKNAFQNCSSITTVKIGNSVTTIGEGAFSGCDGLTSITIPDSVTTIGEGAFSWCDGLTSVMIPNSVTSIGAGAFSCGYSLDTITVDSGNASYHSAGNCIIETATKTLVVGCKNSVIPADGSVMTIGESAFADCYDLTSINIPDSVTTIGYAAFEFCGLTNIEIPDSVTTIGDYAFSNSAITSITLGNSIESIGCGTFSHTGLTSIEIPDSVTTIGENAFLFCTGLTSVTLGNSIKEIGTDAFQYCWSLTSIEIPDSVTTIGEGAFFSCDSLTSITIPDSVTTIGDSAFADCFALTDIYCEAKSKTSGWSDDWNDECDATVHWGYKPVPVKITTQPKTVSVQSGKVARVTVSATGDGLTYKWYFKNKGDTKFSLTTTFTGNTYSAEMNSTRAGRQVYCVITDKYGNSVKTNTVTLGMAVKITTQPKTVAVQSGKTAKVTVTATGDGLKYKWYFKNKGDSKFSLTTTFTGNTYSATMDSTRAGRQVYCVITDKYGNSVKTNTVTLGMAVKITTQPKSVAVQTGKTAKVTVAASGDGLTYKWYFKNKGDSKFSLTNTFKSNTYSATMDSTRAGRQVYCVITDKYGNSVKTNTVTLGMAVKITTQPTSVKVANGSTAKVTVKASGDGLKYKWYFKDKGASKFSLTTTFTGTSYSVAMSNARAGRQVYCVITDKYGNSVKTNTVTLNKK